MQTKRRAFLQYLSIMGVFGILGFPLNADENCATCKTIGSTHMDDMFDPDGWL